MGLYFTVFIGTEGAGGNTCPQEMCDCNSLQPLTVVRDQTALAVTAGVNGCHGQIPTATPAHRALCVLSHRRHSLLPPQAALVTH